MKLIYWNTNNIGTISQILDICEQESPDLMFLSEIDKELLRLQEELLNENSYSIIENPGCERVSVIAKQELSLELGIQNKYYTALILPELELNIISVHLPSQMFQHFDGLKNFIRRFRNEIDNNIGNSGDSKIVAIGDFNVNPFEKPMIDFDGFSATNTINHRKNITHLGEKKQLYYNPTWKLYADNIFPGTKYFGRPSASSFDILEHHFLDQVVISKKLLDSIELEEIKIIKQTRQFIYNEKNSNLVKESDHLPLSYSIKLK